MSKQTSKSSRPRSVPARCDWYWITNMIIRRDGRRSFRFQLRSAARRRRFLEWVKKAEVDGGKRTGVPTDMAEKLKALERENRELRQANEILPQGVSVFCPGGARPPGEAMIAFIDEHREVYGIEPICEVLPIAPSTYHAHIAQRIDPSKRSARAQRDAELKIEVQRGVRGELRRLGARKVWRQLRREASRLRAAPSSVLCRALACKARSLLSLCVRRSAISHCFVCWITSTVNSMY